MENSDFSITYKKTSVNLDSSQAIRGEPYNDIHSLKNMGFQASKTYDSYTAIKHAIKNNYKIALGFTSNTISGGLRDLITNLCKLKLIDCIVTTGGGIEEDLIKCKVPFYYSVKKYKDETLYELGVNRTENILCPNEGYVWLEDLLKNLGTQKEFYNTTSIQLVNKLADSIDNQDSYLYWCYKNSIPVIPIGIEDGAIGDHFCNVYYKRLYKNLPLPVLDSSCLIPTFINTMNSANTKRKICVISLGGGANKHFLMNGCIPLGGADMAIYYNNGSTEDGSNASAPPKEARSWGKLKSQSVDIKVFGDFYFTFYLVASQLIKDYA